MRYEAVHTLLYEVGVEFPFTVCTVVLENPSFCLLLAYDIKSEGVQEYFLGGVCGNIAEKKGWKSKRTGFPLHIQR